MTTASEALTALDLGIETRIALRGHRIARSVLAVIDVAVACPRSRARLCAQEAERVRATARMTPPNLWDMAAAFDHAADCLAAWATTLEAGA